MGYPRVGEHKRDVWTNDVANTFSNIVRSIFFFPNYVFNNINVAGFHGVWSWGVFSIYCCWVGLGNCAKLKELETQCNVQCWQPQSI